MAVDAVEDHVSMASVAARKARQVIGNAASILAVELICACQALDLVSPLRPSPPIVALHRFVRGHVPFVDEDRPLYGEIAGMTVEITNGAVAAMLELVDRSF
jgi:histidine ammonia-lyase